MCLNGGKAGGGGWTLGRLRKSTEGHYPLALWSRKLTPRQQPWSLREQETYAVVCAIKKCQNWVGTNGVEVFLTDRAH